MASQSQVGSKTTQELMEELKKVRVLITDWESNSLHVYNDDSKGSSSEVIISDNVNLKGARMHCNDSFIVVALYDGVEDGIGGYLIANVDDFTKNQSQIVNLSFSVFAIFITNDNKVALGGTNGNVQLDQVDVNGKQTIWCKKIHDSWIRDIKVHNTKIFTASKDTKCGVIAMSDGSVLHMFNAPHSLHSVCVVDDDVILTGCLNGEVYRHDMSTRATSLFVTPGRSGCFILTLALSIDSNILYCGGNDSTLYAINMKTNNTLLWKIKFENGIYSICLQDGIICVGVARCNVVCVNEQNGEIITTLTIKARGAPWGIVMIPPTGLKPIPPSITDPHKQCKEQIQQLTLERDAIKQIANVQLQQAQQQIRQLSQQLETPNQQHAQQIHQSQLQLQQAQQQIDQLKQQIIELEVENNKFKNDQARDRLNSLITKINNLSGPEVLQIANVYNINLTDVDTTKLATANMLAHSSFDEFFEELDIDPLLHDSLLHLYSLIKRAQEIDQFPVERPIAPWIAQQGQPEIAARFAELNYTEEMFVNVDPKLFVHRYGFKLISIKKLQADFIVSQTGVSRLFQHDTTSGYAILMSFDPNSPEPSA